MQSKGIRIPYSLRRGLMPELPEVLKEINDGHLFHWSIWELDAVGTGEKWLLSVNQSEIRKLEKGYLINWNDLNLQAKKFQQVIWLCLMGSKDENFFRQYKNDQERYEACDYVIEMFDGGWWDVFSKDAGFIDRLSKKFKEIEFLETYCNKHLEEG